MTKEQNDKLNFTSSFSPTLPSFQELGDNLDSWLGWKNKFQTTQKLLSDAEKEIIRLEEEKQQWLKDKQELEQTQINQASLLTKQTQQLRQLDQLKTELKESNDDFYQISEEKEKFKQLLNQEKINSRQLESKLKQQTQENYWLRTSYKQSKEELLAKISELSKFQKLGKEEKQQWQKAFTEQEEKYEIERKLREQKFTKQIDNLRTFQLTADIPSRFKKTHKSALSTSSLPTSRNNSPSPRNSYVIEDDRIIFSPQPNNFKSELNRTGYQEKGGIIASDFTTTPQQEETDPFADTKKNKRHSNSPLFVNSLAPEENAQSYEELMNTVTDFTAETTEEQENNQELLLGIEQLQKEKTELEKSWKDLADEKIEQERILQAFNQKELAWEKERSEQEYQLKRFNEEKLAERQKVKEEIAELKYQLAQSNHKTAERTNRAKQILQEKQDAYNKLDNDLVEISKLVIERDLEIEKLKQEKTAESEKKKEKNIRLKEQLLNLGKQINKNEEKVEELLFISRIEVIQKK